MGTRAAAIDDAKELYNSGQYQAATTKLTELYSKTPNNAIVNQWLGMSLYSEEKYTDASKYLTFAASRGLADANFYLGMTYYREGKYNSAFQNISKYESLMKKSKKVIPEGFKNDIESVKLAKTMLEHVEKVIIVDSMVVDKKDFFKYYKISPEIGSLQPKTILGTSIMTSRSPVYVPQSGERRLWSASTDGGNDSLYQSNKLMDGSWDTPHLIDANMNMNGDSSFPFAMPDGASIYFASNGDNSLGGYDIFVAGKDLESGEYYKPQNIGMPFNSPYDDYMYVIDEVTGAGWWASDRNQIPGKLTIYIFKPNDVRVNYEAGNENIESLALVKSIKDTWEDGTDYSDLLEKIKNIDTSVKKIKNDFKFIIYNKRVYTTLSDFKSAEAKNMMSVWVKNSKDLKTKSETLKQLRAKYATNKNDNNVSSQIISLEKELYNLQESLANIANDIRKLEK